MDKAASDQLAAFATQVRAMTDEVNRTRGKEAERLQMELSGFMGRQMPALMAQGLSVMEIQNAVRAATDIVPQTYAPDADAVENEPRYTDGGLLDPPISETTYFLPVDEANITSFAAGELEPTELWEIICESPDGASVTMPEGLELVLTDYGKSPGMEGMTGGGEIVAGMDGEAFMPEFLEVTPWDGNGFLVSEPMVFKSPEEVKGMAALLAQVDERLFRKKADIKKLIKAGWLDAYTKSSVKKEAEYIIGALWDEFVLLRGAYSKAVDTGLGMVVFAGYEGDETISG